MTTSPKASAGDAPVYGDVPAENSLFKPESFGEMTSENGEELIQPAETYTDNTVAQAAIDSLRKGLDEHSSSDGSCKAIHLFELAKALRQRYRQTWNVDDIEESINLLRQARAATLEPGDKAHAYPENLACPGGVCLVDPPTCPQKDVSDEAGPNSPAGKYADFGASCDIELVNALDDRYKHLGQYEDVEEQNRLCDRFVAQFRASPDSLSPAILGASGVSRRTRYEAKGALDDLSEAIELLGQALGRSSGDDHSRHRYLSEYGRSIKRRFQRSGNRDDVSRAIELQEEALGLCVGEHPDRQQHIFNLADLYWERSTPDANEDELQRAVELFRESLELRPPGHRDRHMTLNGLGVSHHTAFQLLGRVEDLTSAIGYFQDVLDARGPDHPECIRTLVNLTVTLWQRAGHVGDIRDLEAAVRMGREAVNRSPKNHLFRYMGVINLAGALLDLFVLNGDISMFEESVHLHRETLETVPPGHVLRPQIMFNYAYAIREKFAQTEEMNDLLEVINQCREILEVLSPGHHLYTKTLGTLAEGLRIRFELLGALTDLQEAIAIYNTPIEAATGDHIVMSDLLEGAATAYLLRYKLLADEDDFAQALSRLQEMLRLRPRENLEHYRCLLGFSAAFRARFMRLRNEEDISSAVNWQLKALACSPIGQPSRAEVLGGLASLHLIKGTSHYDLVESLNLLREVIEYDYLGALKRLSYALDILGEMEDSLMDENVDSSVRSLVLRTYQIAIQLLPRVAYFGLDHKSRLRTLNRAESLATHAALRALVFSEPEAALEMLEQGRAVFWSQYLRTRTSFDALPIELSQELSDISRQLEAGASAEDVSHEADNRTKMLHEAEAARKRHLGLQFESLVEQARSLPGFERFLLHDTARALSQAAEKGPVVIFLGNKTKCHALLIPTPTSKITSIVLPTLSMSRLRDLNTLMSRANAGGRDLLENRVIRRVQTNATLAYPVLEYIWKAAIHPVVEALEAAIPQKDGPQSRSRLFICSTGIFAHVPLHAAGAYKRGGVDCLADHFLPSYVPTLGSLLNARRALQPITRKDVRILLAAVPRPFKWTSLPCAAVEVANIRDTLPPNSLIDCSLDSAQPSEATGSATKQDVLDNLPDASILHLACHGYQDPGSPLDSGFIMKDDMLSVSSLMSMKLPNAFLAFLSACETAKGDDKQPDQAIHLAATMLFAGFKSVIGTMWSMGDIDGPLVAKTFYEQLFAGDSEFLDPDIVPHALDVAVRQLRANGLHASRWATYVHLGL